MPLADYRIFVVDRLPVPRPQEHWSQHPSLQLLFEALDAAGYAAETLVFARTEPPGNVDTAFLAQLVARGCELITISEIAERRLTLRGLPFRSLLDPRLVGVRHAGFYRAHVLQILQTLVLR